MLQKGLREKVDLRHHGDETSLENYMFINRVTGVKKIYSVEWEGGDVSSQSPIVIQCIT